MHFYIISSCLSVTASLVLISQHAKDVVVHQLQVHAVMNGHFRASIERQAMLEVRSCSFGQALSRHDPLAMSGRDDLGDIGLYHLDLSM